jgi:hypothetical protein
MNLQNTNERQVQKQLQKRHQGKNKCKSSDKNLDNTSRLIEAALSGSNRKASGFAGGYLLGSYIPVNIPTRPKNRNNIKLILSLR